MLTCWKIVHFSLPEDPVTYVGAVVAGCWLAQGARVTLTRDRGQIYLTTRHCVLKATWMCTITNTCDGRLLHARIIPTDFRGWVWKRKTRLKTDPESPCFFSTYMVIWYRWIPMANNGPACWTPKQQDGALHKACRVTSVTSGMRHSWSRLGQHTSTAGAQGTLLWWYMLLGRITPHIPPFTDISCCFMIMKYERYFTLLH